MPHANAADFTLVGRLSGDDLLSWLCEQSDLVGWWLCYDASAYLLEQHPNSCLAHFLGVKLDAAAAGMAASGLIGKGVKAAERARLLGGVDMTTSRVSLCSSKFNFFWLGARVQGRRERLDVGRRAALALHCQGQGEGE